jgi:hypothetical protein
MGSLRLPKVFSLNKEFNDLGVIFLRHGPPNRIEQTMGKPNQAFSPNELAMMPRQMIEEEYLDSMATPLQRMKKFFGDDNFFGPTAIDAHQSWVYFASGDEPQSIFHFALHNTATQNWRLSPLPGDPGTTLDRDMLDLLAMYDSRYELLKKTGNSLKFSLNVGELQLEEEKVVAKGLTTDRHVWNNSIKEITIPHAIDAFRSTSRGTLLDISYAIPYAPLREAAGPNTKKVLVEVGLSTTSRSGNRVLDTKRDTLDLLLTPDGKGSYLGLFRQVLVSDSVQLMAHVRALQTPAVGTWTEQVRVPSFKGTDFMLSDLQLLLPATYGPLIEIDGVKVQQSPFKSYARTRPLFAYLQIYNLVKDMNGSAGYTARFTLAPIDLPNEASVLAEVKRDLTGDTRSEFQMLDIKGISPGKYLLAVAVTDKKRVETLVRSREIEITR